MFRNLTAVTIAAAALGAAGVPAASAATPPTLYVSALAKSDPACGSASQTNPFKTIAGALACSSDGTLIEIGAGHFTGGFTIPDSVTLQGVARNGATVIATPTAMPDSLTEITDAPGTTVVLRDLTVNGAGATAGYTGQPDIAAGSGSLTLIGDTVENGQSLGVVAGGVQAVSSTGAVSLTLQGTTVAGDSGISGPGGVLVSGAPGAGSQLNVDNSTIDGNTGIVSAGGILAINTSVALDSATIDANSGSANYGGGIDLLDSSLATTDTILAGNTGGAAADCELVNTAVSDGGDNILGVQTPGAGCSTLADGQHGDHVGTPASPLNPELGPLAANGGPTPTQALLAGSPAIGADNATACQAAPVNATDQRGTNRNVATRSTCDIGAYDPGKATAVLHVSAVATSNPACSSASSTHPFETIAAALACSSNGTEIAIGAGHFTGGFTIPANVTLQGVARSGGTVISTPTAAPDSLTEITDAPGTSVVLHDLTVNGVGATTGYTGQADIAGSTGSLFLVGDTIENGQAIGTGAGGVELYSSTGGASLTVQSSTITGDSGLSGPGGVFVDGAPGAGSQLAVDNSTIEGNTGISSIGGIYTINTSVALDSATIDANSGASSYAGGIELLNSALATTNTIVAGNTGGAAADCELFGTPVTDGGNNILGVQTPVAGCDAFVNGAAGDQVGTPASPINPDLGPLKANGGLTPTQALLSGSPAASAGNAAACEASPISNKDQRGDSRNAATRNTCDIGAYDSGVTAP